MQAVCCTLYVMLDLQSAPRALGPQALGERLKAARAAKALTLRAVEAQAGISNGYLSQLESGLVKAPSPPHLFQLASLYGVDYSELFQLAGYPLPGTVAYEPMLGPAGNGTELAQGDVAFPRGYLTEAELQKVRQYVEDLVAARRGRG